MNTSIAKTIYDISDIKNKVPGQIHDLVLTLFPQAQLKGGNYRIGSISGEKGESLCIYTKAHNAGVFVDYADDAVKGDAIKMVQLAKGCSVREAIAWLANFLGCTPIQEFTEPTRSSSYLELASKMRPLAEKAVRYANSRKLSEATVKAYGVGSGLNNDLLFPYYDCEGRLGMLKHWSLAGVPGQKKETWVEPGGIPTLFGKDVCDPEKIGHERLVICEGEIDAMSCFEVGIPAVSIPMGVSNMRWIDEDYSFLSQFSSIVLMFDSDEPGRKASKEVAARLGSERCMIVQLPLKDANEMLKAGQQEAIGKLIEDTLKEPVAEIVEGDLLRKGVRSYIRGDYLEDGDPFFLPDFDLSFRKHEITLWFGSTGHGKSTAVQNHVANLAARGQISVVASFEQPPERTMGAIMEALIDNPEICDTPEFDKAFDFLKQHVFMYRSRDRTNVKHLLKTFEHAHKRHGVTNFVVDNIMTLDVDRGDNTAQAQAADLLRLFAAQYPVHLHVVAHPRKPPGDSQNAPPSANDIRGAAEWGDMPNNILVVWRDLSKSEHIAELRNSDYTEQAINDYWKSTPCGKILCRKQRATGEHPVAKYWFHKPTKRFMTKPGTPNSMYSERLW
jgi:twinkle protein